MAGLSSTLNIAKTGLSAQQYGLNVTGNNIANVNNEDYSLQSANHSTTGSQAYGGYLLGTGVDVDQVEQQVDQLLENRLTGETSTLAAFEEAESYITILEGYFDESSDSSLTSVLSDFWNAWHDLADNPLGSAERGLIYEQANLLSDRFNTIATDLDNLAQDLTNEITSTVDDVNTLAMEIAQLNYDIKRMESSGTANDLRDQRNGLIDELAQLVNVDIIQEGDGDLIINVANGAPLVNGIDYYSLAMDEGQVMWQGSSGYQMDITDDISGGKLSGWLDIRDQSIPKYSSEIDELASEMIWAMNFQQSQGVGLTYYGGTLTGSYSVDESGWLSSYDFGHKIDYSGDVTVWVEDMSEAEAAYRKIMVDMGVSEADVTNWTGTEPGGDQVTYEMTVVDAGDVGDKTVTETSGDYLAQVYDTSSGGASTALDNILAEQTITLYNTPNGTETIQIADSSADAIRSAASIAEALNEIEGVEAYASPTSAEFDITGITNAHDGDEVQYSLYVDGIVYQQSFIRDSAVGTLDEQFEDSLVDTAQAINNLNGDTDLYADGFVITSDKGATLGIQDFEVQDNAGIQLDTFLNFNNTDVVTWNIATDGVPTTSTDISVDLTNVSDTTDQSEMATVFYDALSDALDEDTFTVELDTDTDAITIRTLDGSNITLQAAGNDSGDDATISLTDLAGTTTSGVGNTSLEFNALASDVETFNSDTTSADTLQFSMTGSGNTAMAGTTSVVTESTYTAAGATTAAAIMGSVTILTDEGISLQSDTRAATGLFGTSGNATTGSSIMTFGGGNGFEDFDLGDTITFEVDGNLVDLTIPTAAGSNTDYALATLLTAEFNADLAGQPFTVIQNGNSVSIIKDADQEDPIEITNFTDGTTGDAALVISTGSGSGTEDPENGKLESGNTYRDFATSTLYDDEAVIYWEKRDEDGFLTGESGLVTVSDEGTVDIVESGVTTLSFDISGGTLVAGNTMSVNMDENGQPDPLDFTISNQANSVNDLYTFEVISGGTVGHEPGTDEEELTIQWSNSVSSGTFVIEGHDPPRTPAAPVEVTVDGMTLSFYDGTLFEGDVFTITTDDSGIPLSTNADGKATGETMSDWHWTLDSFADQFNRDAGGLTASVNSENQLKIGSSEDYHVIENVEYSGQNGFSEDNVTIEVLNYGALDFNAYDFQFIRDNDNWGILNDATGGVAQIIPEGGDDNEFQVDLNGDGIGDLTIEFAKEISGDGYVQFDLVPRDATDINFAFGDDSSTASGLLAAAGINTFFEGSGASSMEVNSLLANTNYIAAGVIDSSTGQITEGDNTNAVAFSDIQYQSLTMKEWTFVRGQDAVSSLTDATMDEYYHTLIASLGLESSSIQGSREF
ncbi:MAG: flagellar hook-associated protein FlgK, partial [Desulfobacterales bacterium]|nr:flagellar hook-associated protein FlgK [Desulfobacterales bacterium]